MALPTQTFEQFVQSMTTQWGVITGIAPSLSSGSFLLAVFQAVAGQEIFLQAQAQLVNDVARVKTSDDGDVDSFMAQFGFYRVGATMAEGDVTLTAPSAATVQVLVFPATIIQTPGGAVQYQVIADTTQPAWSPSANAYVLPIGQTTIDVTVQALVAGSASNVLAGQLTQIGSPLAGIGTCNNASPINNGINAESDDAFRARFVLWINSLSKATQGAILAAVAAVQQGLNINLLENQNQYAVTQLGEFTVVVDDGSGNPPSSLLAAVFNAVNAVRAFTVRAIVVAPTVEAPTISMNVRVATGYVTAAVEQAVAAAVLAQANSGLIGQTLFVSALEQAALTVPGCSAVEPGQTLIAGENADYTLTGVQRVLTTAENVTIGSY